MAKKEYTNSMADLKAMKLTELKKIAPNFEVTIITGMKKADIIKAIFESNMNTSIDIDDIVDAPVEAKAEVKAKVKEEKKPVFLRPKKVRKRRINFQ